MAADTLSQLLEASWRGIAFPTTLVQTEGTHDTVSHRRMDRNGRRVENTGFVGYTFRFRIPCINTIARGVNETWDNLYPDTYRRLLGALEDRSTDYFGHPDLGFRKCKVGAFESTLDPDFRGGPTLAVTLIETVDDGDFVSAVDTAVMPIAAQAAADLDAFFYDLDPPPDTGTPGGVSLTDFIKSLGSLADQWGLFTAQWEAAFNRIGYQFEKLGAKFGAEPGFSDNTQRLLSSLHAMRINAMVQAATRPTSIYVVPRPTTAGAIAGRTKNTVSEILKLNPAIAARPIVPATTPVRYYSR